MFHAWADFNTLWFSFYDKNNNRYWFSLIHHSNDIFDSKPISQMTTIVPGISMERI